jgi:hypothetical protein
MQPAWKRTDELAHGCKSSLAAVPMRRVFAVVEHDSRRRMLGKLVAETAAS